MPIVLETDILFDAFASVQHLSLNHMLVFFNFLLCFGGLNLYSLCFWYILDRPYFYIIITIYIFFLLDFL